MWFVYGNDFLDIILKEQSREEILDKLNLIMIKNFCTVNDNIKRMRSRRMGEHIFEVTAIKKAYQKYTKNTKIQQYENEQNNLKMVKIAEHTPHQIRYTAGKEIHETLCNIIGH